MFGEDLVKKGIGESKYGETWEGSWLWSSAYTQAGSILLRPVQLKGKKDRSVAQGFQPH